MAWPTHPAIFVAAAFCLDDEGRLLLVKQKDREYWTPPGGEIDKGETPEQAAIRETKEELNIDIEIRQNLPPLVSWQTSYNAVLVLFNFYAEIKGGRIKYIVSQEPEYDVEKHLWLSPVDIDSYRLADNVKLVLPHLEKIHGQNLR